jgi:hypothetical protein
MAKMDKFTHFNKKYATYFAISMLALVIILIVAPEWCWVAFPFVCTFFVEMLGWIR